MLGRTVKCGSLRVLLIFVTHEGRALVAGPFLCSGPSGTRKYTRTGEPSGTAFGTQSPLFLEPDGPRLKTICCPHRVPERRRFPGGGSGTPVAWRLFAASG